MAINNGNGRNTRQPSLGYRNPIALRLDPLDEKVVREMAAKQSIKPTTICRLAVREYIANHRASDVLVYD